jgi:AraC-like DNA-binding protein
MITGNTREGTKLARVPLLLLDHAERQGLNRAELMAASNLAEGELADPDSRIGVRSVIDLWTAVISRLGTSSLGLDLGSSISAKDLGLVGYAMYHSADLFGAFKNLERFYRIISEVVRFDVVRDEMNTTLTHRIHPSLIALRHPVETAIAGLAGLARELTGEAVAPKQVHLPFPEHGSQQDFLNAFGVYPQFGSDAATIVFSNRHMALPVKTTDLTLLGYLTELAETTMQSLHTPQLNFEQQVREALWKMLPYGKPDLWRTAKMMSISPRTLQRRLRDEGSSFSSVLENLRRGLSAEMLRNRNLAVAEVAFLLGYSEPSAFQRAFRRWHGAPPGAYKAG